MSLKFQGTGPPLLLGLFAGPARRGTGLFAAALFAAAFLAGFLVLAVFFAIFLRATFIPLSMPLISRQALARLIAAGEVADMKSAKDSAASRAPAPLAGSSMHAS